MVSGPLMEVGMSSSTSLNTCTVLAHLTNVLYFPELRYLRVQTAEGV